MEAVVAYFRAPRHLDRAALAGDMLGRIARIEGISQVPGWGQGFIPDGAALERGAGAGTGLPVPPPALEARAGMMRLGASPPSPLERRPDGGIAWQHRGPTDDIEWAFTLNRHAQLVTLTAAWCATGDRAWAQFADGFLADWLGANPAPDRYVHDPVWRELEVGLRLGGPWPLAFHTWAGRGLSDATVLGMLASVHRQADYLQRFHGRHANHLLMEMGGLAAAAVFWPEFRRASDWRAYALEQVLPQVTDQVYPDGAQKELTAGYHLVALVWFDVCALLLGEDAAAVATAVERMWQYIASIVRPDGYVPNNNDGDHCSVSIALGLAAAEFKHSKWLTESESRFLPWAGQLVSRSTIKDLGHWSFFDVGPLGISGHQHRDKLHLSVMAHGRDLLVDSGRGWYRWDTLRQYFIGTHGHNCVLVDGNGQADGVETVDVPHNLPSAVMPGWDYCRGRHDEGFLGTTDRIVHDRAVLYLRDRCWLVVDRLVSGVAHDWWPLWHFHPDCDLKIEGDHIATNHTGLGHLRVVPLGGAPWRVELVRGAKNPHGGRYRMWKADITFWKTDPQDQGWWSPVYNDIRPAACAVYRAAIPSPAIFAWLLVPGRDPVPAPAVQFERLGAGRVRISGDIGGAFSVELDLDGGLPMVAT